MAGENADRVCDELDAAMRNLRTAMKGMPDPTGVFKRKHERATKSVGHLVVLIEDARSTFGESS